MLARRHLLLLASAALASGCENNTVKTLRFAYQFGVSGLPDVPITPEQVAASPYAMIYAKIGRGPRSVLVLGQKQGDELSWISADRMAVVTRSGRVTKTAGLSRNLKGTTFLQPDPLSGGPLNLGGRRAVTRIVDYEDDTGYGAVVEATYTLEGRQTFAILGRQHHAEIWREDNFVKSNGWSFQNHFWIDPDTGFVWKSIQHTLREYPPLDIEVLKPAA
ncbi:MAG: YjbF family lipoprotein [Rhodospirillales bacterium]|nr:YjbF family lipoprotein [Rhodospirillales bacterium]